MKLYYVFCLLFFYSQVLLAKNFSPLAPGIDAQFFEITKALKDDLLNLKESIILIEDHGHKLIYDGHNLSDNCKVLEIHWQSQVVNKNSYRDNIVFNCSHGRQREIIQSRVGENLKPFTFEDWINFNLTSIEKFEKYSLYISDLDLRLEWQQDIDQNILTLSVKDLHHINFDYLFSERWSPQPQRQYQMKVSNFEFVTDQTTE